MPDYFCNYEQALALKELGFDEPCFAYYQKSAVIGNDTILPIQIMDKASNFNDAEYSKMGVPFCSAPLKQQVFKWFRDKGFDFAIMEKYKDKGKFYGGYINKPDERFGNSFGSNFKTYEEAESACIDNLIEILKEE